MDALSRQYANDWQNIDSIAMGPDFIDRLIKLNEEMAK
jgi:hypothetical protein